MPDHYRSDELKSLARILNDILAEAQKYRPDLSKDEVVALVFSLADCGERDAKKLHRAVFGKQRARSTTHAHDTTLEKLSLGGMTKIMPTDMTPRRYRFA
jgi:hypothetical protein